MAKGNTHRRAVRPLIRFASSSDVPQIRAIARGAYAKYVTRIGREPSPMVADYDGEVALHRVVVIEVDGKVSGYMVAWPQEDAYWIENIGVEPTSQGGGLGRRLIEHAVGEAQRLRLPGLRLCTNVAMVENLSMYTSLGFVETHRGTSEKGFNVIYMRLSLAESEHGHIVA